MKNLIVLIFVVVAYYAGAQTTCQTAQPFCAGGVSGVTFPATTGSTTAGPGPNYGCLGTQPNPAWYYLQIGNSGSLDILIQGVTTSQAGPGQDVDFICWGPFNSLAGICNSLTAANTIDCSYSASYTETLNIVSGVTGQYYLVLITNFANVPQNILFSQFGGTGDTNCGLVTSNTTICQGGTVAITTNTPSGLSNVVYSLMPGNYTSNTPTFIVSPTVTTSYSIFATGVNTVNATLTQSATSNVTVNPVPVSAPTLTNTTCTSNTSAINLALTFIPTNASPTYTISWSTIPNGINSSTQTSVNGVITPGPYSATITAAGGCKTIANFSVLPKPAPAEFTITPIAGVYSITCYQPTITLTANNAANATITYTWTNGLIPAIYNSVADIDMTGVGNWTCNALNTSSGCRDSKTFVIGQNTIAPTSVITPTFQNITCVLNTITTVTLVATPSVNINQIITAPNNATYSSNSSFATYLPGGPGIYNYCVVNGINGCSTCKQFTVASNQGFPSSTIVSPQNFTLGCGTKSVATINIINGQTSPPGGTLLYGMISPTAPNSVPIGTAPIFSIIQPGTYTMVTRDNNSLCENRIPVSVLSNTFGPALDSVRIPQRTLTCYNPGVVLQGISQTPNISYQWAFVGTPGIFPTSTISVQTNTAKATNTVVGSYTLTLTDNNNTCITTTVVTITQNIYRPNAVIYAATSSITCNTPTIMLTNSSTSGVPPGSVFQPGIPVAELWQGPSPQTPMQVSSTYVAATVGEYTMVAKDLNNGCTSQTLISIGDGRVYPAVTSPTVPFILDCGAKSVDITPIIKLPINNLAYHWQLPQISAVSGVTNAVLTTTTIGQYKILVTNTVNGCASVGEVSVSNGTLNADFEPDPYSCFAPFPVKFTNLARTSLDPNGLGISTVWGFGNGTYSTTPSATISPATIYNMSGTYSVTAYFSKGNCGQSITKLIQVEIPSEMVIPNVFTPNGDKVNDEFFLIGSSLSSITIRIYDRWGNEVFYQISSTGNINWDGKNFSGKEVPDGTYFYLIKAEGKDGNKFDKKGTVAIFR
ncbi:MAG: gliding motility-associated C-terminal domain-containing protein [Bacteroidia bacterium]|nr:gliding motility-associated C-terminal domain-containing protein [Bacteroidia bacterium]